MFFSTGGVFSRQARPADLDAARLGRRGIARWPAPHESRPRPSPVAGAVRSQSRKNRVSFAGDPSDSAVPSRLRETQSAIHSSSKNKMSVNPMQFPCEKLFAVRNTKVYVPQIQRRFTHTQNERRRLHSCPRKGVRSRLFSGHCARLTGRYRSVAASLSSCSDMARCQMGGS